MLLWPIKSNTTSKCSKSIIFCHNILLGVWNDISVNFSIGICTAFCTLSVSQGSEYKNKGLTYNVFSPNLKNFRKNHVELKILIISKILSTEIKIYIQYPVHISYNIWYYILNILWWFEVGKLQKFQKKNLWIFFFTLSKNRKFSNSLVLL